MCRIKVGTCLPDLPVCSVQAELSSDCLIFLCAQFRQNAQLLAVILEAAGYPGILSGFEAAGNHRNARWRETAMLAARESGLRDAGSSSRHPHRGLC